jgi:SAM-dependent methyltransferase
VTTFDREWRARFERFGRSAADDAAVSGWSAEGLRRRLGLFEQLVGELSLGSRCRVLELGCGAGTYVRHLAGLGHAVVGADYSMPSLGRALEADPGRKGTYVAADGYDLPFVDRCFDLAVSIGVLQAVSAPERLIDEAVRVLRPGGILLVETLNPRELPAMAGRVVEKLAGRPPRVRAYAPRRLERCLEARSVRVVRRIGVYLPPRQLPWLGRPLDWPIVTRLMARVSWGSALVAHAFWFVGRKSR